MIDKTLSSFFKAICTISLILGVLHPNLAQFEISDIEPGVLQVLPTASEPDKYGEVQVSLSSDIPNVSIPLTSFKAIDIEVPISLSYYYGGLKVNSYSAWGGLGWSLNAGEVISRTIIGRSDYESGDFETTEE